MLKIVCSLFVLLPVVSCNEKEVIRQQWQNIKLSEEALKKQSDFLQWLETPEPLERHIPMIPGFDTLSGVEGKMHVLRQPAGSWMILHFSYPRIE